MSHHRRHMIDFVKIARELALSPTVVDESVRKMWCGKIADELEHLQGDVKKALKISVDALARADRWEAKYYTALKKQT